MIGIGTGVPVVRALGKGGNAHVYELRDEFVADEAAPITSPRTVEPGPGTLTVTDTEDKFSISGGKLVCAGGKAAPVVGDPGIWSDSSFTRAAGLALITRVSLDVTNKTTIIVGFDNNQADELNSDSLLLNSTSRIQANVPVATSFLGFYVSATSYEMAVVLRLTGGAFFFINGGIYSGRVLLWVSDTDSDDPVFIGSSNVDSAYKIDTYRALDLPANGYTIWSDDYGIATDRLAGARSATDTFTHEADCLIEFEATTLPSTGTVKISFREQDASNRWDIQISSTGTIVLKEFVGGSPTTRGSAETVLSGGERIVITVDDEEMKVYYDNVLAFTYSSASNYKTETAGNVLALEGGSAVSNIVTWPRILGQLANTDLLAGAISDGSTFTHDSDCRIVFTITTLPSSGDAVVEFRRQDANDYWRVLINSAGDLALQKVLNGVSQGNHILGSGVLSGGERVTVIAQENHYTLLFDDTLVGTHDDSFVLFNSFTDGRVGLGTGGVVDDLVAWPLPSNAGDEAYISLEAASA